MAKCLHPINIRNPAFQSNQDIDNGAYTRLLVPCGKCAHCLSNKAAEWAYRLEQELKISSSYAFVTLTYNNENLPVNENGYPCFDKPAVQKFIKRLRKKTENKLKYFLVAEYGSRTHRPHYHMILFNFDGNLDLALQATWPYGNYDIGTATPESIRYTTKYSLKGSDEFANFDPVWRIMSKNLGKNYIEDMQEWHHEDDTRFYCNTKQGHKIAMPRYYREKIYDKPERTRHATRANARAIQAEERKKKYFMARSRAKDNETRNSLYYKSIEEEKTVIQRRYETKSKLEKL